MLPVARLFHHLLNCFECGGVFGDALMEQIDVEDVHPNVHLHVLGHLVVDALLIDLDGFILLSDLEIIVCLTINEQPNSHDKEQHINNIIIASALLNFF